MDALATLERWPTCAVEAPQAAVAVRRSGGDRPLVMLHGFSDDSTCWAAVAVALAREGWDVVLPDARGHGRTPMPAGAGFTHEGHVADAIAVLEALTGPTVLVGHSMGANTAAGVAATRPDLVVRLVLEDPPWRMPEDPESDRSQDQANPFEDWLRDLQATDHAGRVAVARDENPQWPLDELDAWASSKARVDLRLFAAEQAWLRRSWREVARDVQAPTLLLTGEPERGAAVDPASADVLSASGWTVRRVPGAGHSVRRDDRAAYLAAVREFLA